MSEAQKYHPQYDRQFVWIEKAFPPNKPILWAIFIWSLSVFSATLLAFLKINECLPSRHGGSHFNPETCAQIFSSAGSFGLENYISEWLLVFVFAVMMPLAFYLLRRNRFNWLKKTGRWKKEWDQ